MAELKLNKKLIEKAFPLIAEGNFAEVVYMSLGISKSTYFRWLAQGEQDEIENRQSIYRDFLDSKNEADSIAEMKNVENIKRAAIDGTWQASAWLLERKHKNRWSQKQDITLSGNPDAPLEIKTSWTE